MMEKRFGLSKLRTKNTKKTQAGIDGVSWAVQFDIARGLYKSVLTTNLVSLGYSGSCSTPASVSQPPRPCVIPKRPTRLVIEFRFSKSLSQDIISN